MSKTLLIEPKKTGVNELTLYNDGLTGQSEVLKFSTQTVKRLKTLQRVICFEEGRYVSVDNVLDLLLTFYRQFVPFD